MSYSPVDGEYFWDNTVKTIVDAENNTGVISGMSITENGGGADQSVDVAAGVYIIAGTRVSYAGGNIVAPAADANNPRKDILVADNAGAISFVQGTAASALPTGEIGTRTYQPVPPNIPASRIMLAEVWREANDNTIANADITEKFISIPSRMIGRELLTAQGQVIYASGAQTPAVLSPGVNGQFLKTQGAGANPVWDTLSSDFQEFVTSDTWTKPDGVSLVIVQCVGSGGGGGGGGTNGGGGGGGGSIVIKMFKADDLGATVSVTVGAGGTGGAVTANGNAGNSTSFSSYVIAYGGGFGAGSVASNNGGGGGGGTMAVGSNASGATGGNGGNPTTQGSTQGTSLGGRGGKGGDGGSPGTAGSYAEYGGAGGGGSSTGGAGTSGGASIFAAGGGGGGRSGSGGAGGGLGGGGNGGASGAADTQGTVGSAPGGGGGGGGDNGGGGGGAGGNGGDGRCRVWSI